MTESAVTDRGANSGVQQRPLVPQHRKRASSGPGGGAVGAAAGFEDAGATAGLRTPVAANWRDEGAWAGTLRFSNSVVRAVASPLVSSNTNRVMASPSL